MAIWVSVRLQDKILDKKVLIATVFAWDPISMKLPHVKQECMET